MAILIYGATGYSGRACAAEAKRRGVDAILGGRNAATVRALADSLGFEAAPFELTDRTAMEAAVARVRAVLNIAGPFVRTAAQMADACIAAGVPYVDIGGEFRSIDALAARDAAARTRGVMLLPAAGFGVVPGDCLLAHVAARAGNPTALSLAIKWRGGTTRGTLITVIEMLRDGIFISRNGRRVAVDRPPRRRFTLDGAPTDCVAFNFADVATAPMSTGVGDVTVYLPASSDAGRLASLPPFARRALTSGVGRALLRRLLTLMPEGPDVAKERDWTATLYATAEGGARNAAAKLTLPHPYLLTPRVAVNIAHRAANGEGKAGFQTPSRVFGADYILGFEGVTRTDLEGI
jgi:short subunit dehydrogenase-like uncharacterized protein